MSVLENRRVKAVGSDFHVEISQGHYLVEFDDRDGLWKAYSDGLWLGHPGSTDPLCCSSDARSGWDTPEELIAVLLAFDDEAVPE